MGAPYLGGRVPGIDADVVVLVKSKIKRVVRARPQQQVEEVVRDAIHKCPVPDGRALRVRDIDAERGGDGGGAGGGIGELPLDGEHGGLGGEGEAGEERESQDERYSLSEGGARVHLSLWSPS